MYGLCKVHKCTTDNDNAPPSRPILSAIGTCNYDLAKFFVPLLKQFTVDEYTVKDSFSFSKDIFLIKIQIFLWHLLTVNRCSQIFHFMRQYTFVFTRFLKRGKKIKDILTCHFKQPLILSVKSSCFLFNGVYYKQIDGAVIVSPLGLTLANLFLVSWALEIAQSNFNPNIIADLLIIFSLCLNTKIM